MACKQVRLVCAVALVLCGTFLLYMQGWRLSTSIVSSENNNRKVVVRDILEKDYNFSANGSPDILLSAYMNSGSRFTGRLLGFRSDSFYFYEPLWKFSTWKYYKPPNICCSSTNGYCSNITFAQLNQYQPFVGALEKEEIIPHFPRTVQPHVLLLYVLSAIYSCRLEKVKNVVQLRVHDHLSYSGPSWDVFRQCSQKLRGKTECLRELENVCRNKLSRVTKVIRLTVGAFEPLLKINPRLKVVHLVRDPRAIIQSRLFSRGYPVYGFRQNDSLERNLCTKMQQDIKDLVRIKELYPDRVFILYYEDLLLNLHVRLKHLYKRLNLTYSETEVNALATIRVNILPPEKPFTKINPDRVADNANWWRKHMMWTDVEKLQSACGRVLRTLGYGVLQNENDLRDTNRTILKIPSHFQL